MKAQVADRWSEHGAARARRTWGRLQRPAAWILGVAAVLLVIAVWLWDRGAEGRAIRALPADDRLALYTRTMANLRDLCGDTKPSFRDYCTREAEFAAEFQECEHGCQAIVRRSLSAGRATR